MGSPTLRIHLSKLIRHEADVPFLFPTGLLLPPCTAWYVEDSRLLTVATLNGWVPDSSYPLVRPVLEGSVANPDGQRIGVGLIDPKVESVVGVLGFRDRSHVTIVTLCCGLSVTCQVP